MFAAIDQELTGTAVSREARYVGLAIADRLVGGYTVYRVLAPVAFIVKRFCALFRAASLSW